MIVNGYGTAEPAAGVPASVAVPSPLSVNVTPGGSAPFLGQPRKEGYPVVVTVKVPARPAVKVVPAGAGDLTRRRVDREGEGLGGGRTDTVIGGDREPICGPPVVGVPASVAVPFPLSVNVTPAGSVARFGQGGRWAPRSR